MNTQYLTENYEIIKILNAEHGVYLVQDVNDKTIYAGKILSIYNLDLYKYLLANPISNIPQIKQLIEKQDKLIVIEQYINAPTLQTVLDTKTKSEKELLEIFKKVCLAVKTIHKHNIVHRDIKPSNIIVDGDNVYLIDFNASKFENKNESKDTTLIGTVGYAAPEQYGFGPSTKQSDFYSLGVLLNVLLTNKFPDELKCAKPYVSIVNKCIEINASDRYKKVDEILTDLNKPIKNSFTPVGFRTGKIWKMIVAIVVSMFCLYCTIFMTTEEGNKLVGYIYNVLLTTCYFVDVAIVFNYRDIQSKIGLNRLNKPLRIFLSWVISFGLIFICFLITPYIESLIRLFM